MSRHNGVRNSASGRLRRVCRRLCRSWRCLTCVLPWSALGTHDFAHVLHAQQKEVVKEQHANGTSKWGTF
jgi:hypothetical protein